MKKIIIRLFIVAFIGYAIFIIINQQKMLNSYANERKQYQNDIEQAEIKHNELTETLDNINSTNYIEEMAREKLDMYLPNERIYVDMDR